VRILICNAWHYYLRVIGHEATSTRVFFKCFRDPIRVPRINNWVPRIRQNYHRVPGIRENRVPRIREIGFLQVHTGHLTFSLKKPWLLQKFFLIFSNPYWAVHLLGFIFLRMDQFYRSVFTKAGFKHWLWSN